MRYRWLLVVVVGFKIYLIQPDADKTVHFGAVKRQGKLLLLLSRIPAAARDERYAADSDQSGDCLQCTQPVVTGQNLDGIACENQSERALPVRRRFTQAVCFSAPCLLPAQPIPQMAIATAHIRTEADKVVAIARRIDGGTLVSSNLQVKKDD